MKKIINTLFSMALMTLLFSACSEEKVELYNGCKSGLFIQEVYSTDIYGNPLSYRDSLTVSFASLSEEFTTYSVRFYVQTMGPTVDYCRHYKLEVLDGTTAVLGEDFDLDRNDFIIYPNQSRDTVYVACHRTPKIRKQTLRIKLGIVANEYFEVPIEGYKNSSSWGADGPINSANSFIVRFNEQYTEPYYYKNFGDGFFGKFTVNRFLELNKVMGWTVSDWSSAGQSGAKVAYGKFDFAARAFQKHLQKRADEGDPLIDDDGESYVQLPSSYAVDYSHIGSKE